MSAGRLLWLVPALSFAFGAAGTVLLGSIPSEDLPREDRLDLLDVLFSLGFVAYAAVGALIAARHPRNAVGWLFCALGLVLPASGLLWAHAMYGIHGSSGGLPGEEWAAWAAAWSSDPPLLILVLLLLLFPNGRFLSVRWRRVGFAAVAAAVLWGLAIAFDPGPLYTFEAVSNPLGVDAAGGVLEALVEAASAVDTVLLVAAGLSLVVRYRRAQATERRQIKWLAAAAAFAVVLIIGFTTLELTVETDRGAGEVGTSVLAFLVLALSPLTEDSGLAIAGSTLAVAALFRPARRRIQAWVDRRFYRRRYDAARTLESFGARLRDQVELDSLVGELRGVVADTLQPAHVSLWLRSAR